MCSRSGKHGLVGEIRSEIKSAYVSCKCRQHACFDDVNEFIETSPKSTKFDPSKFVLQALYKLFHFSLDDVFKYEIRTIQGVMRRILERQ